MSPGYLSFHKHTTGDIKASAYSFAFSMVILTLSVLLSGVFLLLFRASQQMIPSFRDDSGATVTLNPQSSDREVRDLVEELRKWPQVADVIVTLKTESPQRIESWMVDLQRFLSAGAANPDCTSLALRFRTTGEDREKMEASLERLRQFRQVDQIRQEMPWAEKMEATVNFLFYVVGGGIVFCGLAAILVVSNWIQFSLSIRSDELEIHRLLGATPFFSGIPYCVEGAFMGGAGAILAAVILIPAAVFLRGALPPPFAAAISVSMRELFCWAASALGLGLSLGFLGGWLTFRRFFHGSD